MSVTINGNGTITGYTPTTISGTLAATSMPSGSVLQVKSDSLTSTLSNSLATETWWSVYNAGLQVAITPSSASNKILLMAQIMWSEGSGQWYQFRFEENGADIAGTVGDAAGSRFRSTAQTDNQTDNNAGRTITLIAEASAGSTNSRNYNIALRHTSGITRTVYLNRTATDSDNHGYSRGISTITAMEIKA